VNKLNMHEHSPESYYHSETCRARSCAASTSPKEAVFHTANTLPLSVGEKSLRTQGDKTQIDMVHFSPDLDTRPLTDSGMAISRKKFFIRAYFRNRMFSSQAAPSAGKIYESVLWSFASARPARKVKEHRAGCASGDR
jgi:hypothetical protein